MKRVLSVVLCLAIFLGAFSATGFSAFAEEEVTVYNCDDILARYVDLDALTADLSSAFMQCKASVDVSKYNIPFTNAARALVCYINYQMSEFCNVYNFDLSSKNSNISIIYFYYYADYNTPEKFAPIYQQFIAARNEILNGIEGNNALSDVQKSLLVHDRVVSRTAYDYTNYLNDTIPDDDFHIAGVLIYKKAICSGYAAVYAYLMNRLNIDTVTISSDLCNHAWNKTKVEGKWYYVDCTWDDNVHDGVGYVEHDNFLRSAQGLIDTGHIKNGQVDWDDSANNTEYDIYYWRNSNAEFQYINGKFYYIDCVSKTLNIADENHTALCSVSDSYYAALRNYNNKLLFNSKTDVYQYNLSNKIKSKILTPDVKKFGDSFLISGFTTKNEILYIYAYENGYRHSCPLEQRDNYLITCNYNELNFEVQHNFTNNVCTNCGKKNFEYKIENGGAVITGYNGNYFDTEITIPQRLGGYPVTEIGEKAFYQNEDIKKVTFPDTVTKIGSNAFYDCSALEYLQLPKNLIEIYNYAFAYCPLKELVIPDSLTRIDYCAFSYCQQLQSIYIGSSANDISGSFTDCKCLKSITVSPQNTVYDSRDNCNAIILTAQNRIISGCKSTVIPVSVTAIARGAFYGKGIENITIPKSVTEIADYAFGNSDLATVTYLGTQQEWANIKISENNDPLTNAQITYKPCVAHSYNSGVVTTQPTCTKKGIKTFTCTVCGNTKTQDVSATGVHIYVNGYCKDCDIEDKNYTVPTITAPFNQNISVYNGRKYNAKFVPTKNGVIDFYSTGERDTAGCIYDSNMNCLAYNDDYNNDVNFSLKLYVEQGKEYIVSAYVYGEKASGNFNLNLEYEKTAHTHDYTEQIISAPTCSEAGESKYTCTICNHTYTQAVPATGEHINIGGECIYCHTKDKNYVMPTITMPFSQSVKVCADAKYYAKYTPQKDGTITFYSSQDDVDSKGYLYDSNMNLLAENDDIFYEYGSENNNYNFKITYNLKAGKTYVLACSSYYENLVDVLIKAEFKEHIHSYTNSVTKPICTKQGYTTHTCSCGYSYVDSYTDTVAHNYLANVVAPKANAVGYTQYKCSRCSALKKDEAGKVIKYNLTAPTGKPSGFKCASRTATAEKFTWTKTSGVSGYQVQLLNSAGKSAGTATTTGTAYTFSKLTAGSAYKARVRFFIKAADGKNYYGAWATINSPTLPAATSLVKVTGAKKAFTAQWKKGAVTGYQLQYATNNKFSGAKTVTIKKAATLKYTASKLAANKTFYVRIRTYKAISGANYYSTWSAIKAVKTK